MKTIITLMFTICLSTIVVSCTNNPGNSPTSQTEAKQSSRLFSGTYYENGYKLTFLPGHALELVSPVNHQSFSGTYTMEENTIVGDFGFSKEIYQVVDENTISTKFSGKTYLLKKQKGEVEKQPELKNTRTGLTGTFFDNGYKLTFMPGHTAEIVSPKNHQTFSGTYKIDENTIIVDFGFGKEIYQIIDDNSIKTKFSGKEYLLKKQ